ncbi:alanine- and arginine-rich domain-containing protein [Rhinolophus sinicus]|uniref:alanine- and arginine-rich domain-containing protein n=1 Tax=Rhinolophus sinicus TaxID=89399 RepID=UPI003D7A966D
MGLGDLGRCREGMPRGPHAVAVGVGLWPSAPGEEARPPVRGWKTSGGGWCAPSSVQFRAGPPGAAAGEEQSPAGLRAELLEMRFQNRHLAKTLLDLNMKMQQLKKEYALEIASKSQSSEDNAANLE